MTHDRKTPSKKWYGGAAVIAASLALVFSLRGCDSGPSTAAKTALSYMARDRRPDPSQPFPNMNAAGNFVNRGDHTKPQLQIPAQADAGAVAQAVATYVNQLITGETQQLYSANQIQQGIAGASTAGANAFSSAIANGASPQSANQSAMVAAAQYLHNVGVMGPLICPVALGMEGMTQLMVE